MATDSLVGTRIAKRRHVLGLTQEALAARVGVSKASVTKWETGQHYPKRHLGRLEAVLGISLTGDDAETYTDPDEARIWGWTEYTPAERRAMIAALRNSRGDQA